MKYSKSIYGELLEHYKSQNTKIGQKVFDVLNRKGIADIILDNNVFWFEFYSRGNDCSETVYNHIKKLLKKRGHIYLYDIEEGITKC